MPLQIIRQDITKMQVDAIVNTTNRNMIGYSGIDRAIHTLAGAELDAECAGLAPLELGHAKLSGAYQLPCKYVIHTSGPVWQGGMCGESALLRSCYLESLKLAVEHHCRTVALPLISSGAYGYPKDQVLKFAVHTITEFLFEHELTVYLCVFDKESYSFSKQLFHDIQDFIGERTEEETPSECEGELLLSRVCGSIAPSAEKPEPTPPTAVGQSLHEYMKHMDKGFRELLFDLIDESGMTDVECYKKANVDKRTFSKIKGNKDYKPSKQTAVAFAISLHLDLEATQSLLAAAGFALSESRVFDKIIRYFIGNGVYDVFEINEALFEFDQPLLGTF